MGKWTIPVTARGDIEFEVEAADRDEAVAKAWKLFASYPSNAEVEWDIEEMSIIDHDEEYDEGDEGDG